MSRPLSEVREAKLRRYLSSQKKANRHYADGKARKAEIAKITPPGTEIEGPDGKRYILVDNFAGRAAFKTCVVERFDVKLADEKKAPR